MMIQRFENVTQFYGRVKEYLLQHEAMHNLQLGLCNRLVQNSNNSLDNYFAAAFSGDEIIAVIMRTPQSYLLISLTANIDIIPNIAADVHEFYQLLPGVNGPSLQSQAFAQAWCEHTGNKYNAKVASHIYQLDKVQKPNSINGELRLVTVHEKELLKTWYEEFCQEGLGQIDPSPEAWTQRQLNQNSAYFWWHNQPVSMACQTRSTPNGAVISGVYTPVNYRNQGYASNCVAALSQKLLNQGNKYCFLFADIDNPVSNRIYQKIGYQPVGDWQEYSFLN